MMNSNIEVYSFLDSDTLVDELSISIAKDLQIAIDRDQRASLVVSGGSTPKPLFEKLRDIDIDWGRVSIGLCDERWVEPTHVDSNERLIREYLMVGRASKARFVPLYIDSIDIDEAQKISSDIVQRELMPISVVILGMGSDGHTASLFPNNPKLSEGLMLDHDELTISIEPQDAPHKRMSLTRGAILSSKHIYLHFEGAEKMRVFDKALSGYDQLSMPIRSILHQNQKRVEVYCR